MSEKKIRQEYDKRLEKITLRLSVKEKACLKKMMQDDEWTNVAGFIKYQIFKDKTDTIYEKMKRSSEPENIQIIIKNLMENLVNEFGYLNYRFNYELEQAEKNANDTDEKSHKKRIAIMTQYKKSVIERTQQIVSDCQDILKFIDIKVDTMMKESIEYAPDALLEKARKDWNDTMSPEALEGARRDLLEFHRKWDHILKGGKI